MPVVKRLDKSLSTLIKDCDDAFRKYIQKRDEGKPCFICGNPIPKGQAEVCHYIKRANLTARWNEMNAHLGDLDCNRFDEMHEIRYEQRLIDVYGIEKVVELEALGRSLMKPLRSDLVDLIDTYKAKLKDLNKTNCMKEEQANKKKDCVCTGPWDCQCNDVLDQYYGKDEQYQEWLDYGKKVMEYSIEAALQKDIKDVSRYVFEKIIKEYQVIKLNFGNETTP